ncbi:Uu.00g113780.m01.CDS01, partial [Anthostomella pinea]
MQIFNLALLALVGTTLGRVAAPDHAEAVSKEVRATTETVARSDTNIVERRIGADVNLPRDGPFGDKAIIFYRFPIEDGDTLELASGTKLIAAGHYLHKDKFPDHDNVGVRQALDKMGEEAPTLKQKTPNDQVPTLRRETSGHHAVTLTITLQMGGKRPDISAHGWTIIFNALYSTMRSANDNDGSDLISFDFKWSFNGHKWFPFSVLRMSKAEATAALVTRVAAPDHAPAVEVRGTTEPIAGSDTKIVERQTGDVDLSAGHLTKRGGIYSGLPFGNGDTLEFKADQELKTSIKLTLDYLWASGGMFPVHDTAEDRTLRSLSEDAAAASLHTGSTNTFKSTKRTSGVSITVQVPGPSEIPEIGSYQVLCDFKWYEGFTLSWSRLSKVSKKFRVVLQVDKVYPALANRADVDLAANSLARRGDINYFEPLKDGDTLDSDSRYKLEASGLWTTQKFHDYDRGIDDILMTLNEMAYNAAKVAAGAFTLEETKSDAIFTLTVKHGERPELSGDDWSAIFGALYETRRHASDISFVD